MADNFHQPSQGFIEVSGASHGVLREHSMVLGFPTLDRHVGSILHEEAGGFLPSSVGTTHRWVQYTRFSPNHTTGISPHLRIAPTPEALEFPPGQSTTNANKSTSSGQQQTKAKARSKSIFKYFCYSRREILAVFASPSISEHTWNQTGLTLKNGFCLLFLIRSDRRRPSFNSFTVNSI